MSLSKEQNIMPSHDDYYYKRLVQITDRKTSSFDDTTPLIDEVLEFLGGLDDFADAKVAGALRMLADVPHILFDIDKFKERNIILVLMGRYLLQHGYFTLALRIAKSLLQKLNVKGISLKSMNQCQYNLYLLYRMLVDLTYQPEIMEFFPTREYLGIMKQSLLYIDTPANKVDVNYDDKNLTLHVKLNLLISLYNMISKHPSNRKLYRRANIIETISKLEESTMEVKVVSLLLLSYVVDEEESEMLTKSADSVAFLTEMLSKAVESDKHVVQPKDMGDSTFFCAYNAKELLDGINNLTVNDTNKLDILKQGGIQAVIRMLESDFSEEERQLATETLWNLAFIDKIRTNVEVQKTKSTLRQLTRSENESMRNASSYALWEISDHQERAFTSQPTGTDSPPSYEETLRRDSQTSHVMLSYQWDSQDTVLSIRESLTRAGYTIWLDVDHMGGDTLEAMAKAVEASAAVVICITEKYKDSHNCRSEASYAMKLKKPIIPLLLEADYSPDGWLGLILGTKLYFRFCSDDDMTSNMQKLIKEIGNRGLKRRNDDDVDGAAAGVVPEQSTSQHSSSIPSESSQTRSSDVTRWSKEDVQSWLRDNDLAELCSPLSYCRGRQLRRMYDDFCSARDKFEERLEKELGLSYITLSKFTTELEELFE